MDPAQGRDCVQTPPASRTTSAARAIVQHGTSKRDDRPIAAPLFSLLSAISPQIREGFLDSCVIRLNPREGRQPRRGAAISALSALSRLFEPRPNGDSGDCEKRMRSLASTSGWGIILPRLRKELLRTCSSPQEPSSPPHATLARPTPCA